MKREGIYAVIIGVLLAVVIIQWMYLAKRKPAEKIITPPKVAPEVYLPAKPRIAIVIDDWGYHLNTLEIIKDIQVPLTASILPNLKYSSEISRQLHDYGYEIILHLPMEPREKYKLEKDTITTNMPVAQIEGIIDKDLDGLKNARGVSNHMGSKVTADTKATRIILTELKKRGLYFFDSLVTSKSVAEEIARVIGVPFARRDVFLDNKDDPAYIKKQVNALKRKAKTFGYAIGIGHDRKKTLEVLKEVIPVLEKEGYRFVFVSELVN